MDKRAAGTMPVGGKGALFQEEASDPKPDQEVHCWGGWHN